MNNIHYSSNIIAAIKSDRKEYYKKNKERIRQYAQNQYHLGNNKEKTKEYYEKNNYGLQTYA